MTEEEIRKELDDLANRRAKLQPMADAVSAEMAAVSDRERYLTQVLASGREPPTVTEVAAVTNAAVDVFVRSPVIPLEEQPL